MLEIRRAKKDDFHNIWPIFYQVIKEGATFPFSPNTGKEQTYKILMHSPTVSYISLLNKKIVGLYYIKPNQPGLGSHVCNAGYMVSTAFRGRGIGKEMCAHSLSEAKKLGYIAMQYNLVVSTNKTAINLWQKMGFSISGSLPKAFNHKKFGLVDAYIMYRLLE